MFSAHAAMACTSTLGFSAATASIRPTTFAAPLMSCFMSPMPAAGLMLIPPVSNVMPLPTKTIFRFAPLGVHEMCTRRGSRALPRPTASMSFIPRRRISLKSKVTTLSALSLAAFSAACANVSG